MRGLLSHQGQFEPFPPAPHETLGVFQVAICVLPQSIRKSTITYLPVRHLSLQRAPLQQYKEMGSVELWRHERPTETPMWRFLEHVNSKYGLSLRDYPDLYKWSVENVADFWGEVWHFVGIKASKSFEGQVCCVSPLFVPYKIPS